MTFQRKDHDAAEFAERLALAELADGLLEECVKERLSLRASMDRLLPVVGARLGAKGGAVLTRDEELNQAAFSWGDLCGEDAWTLLRPERQDGPAGHTLVRKILDVAGSPAGEIGFLFEGSLDGDLAAAEARVRVIAEELDVVLASVHIASEKQDLIVRLNRALSNRVFEKGLDEAVRVLHEHLRFETFLFIWHDSIAAGRLFYRLYRRGNVEFDSETRQHPGLEEAIRAHGSSLLSPERQRLRAALGLPGAVEYVLSSGLENPEWLGKCLAQPGPKGFSTFALDLVRLLTEMTRDRLVDYNRERRHLAQFFPAPVITDLLREPSYQSKYLRPREERVAILYADINSFTKISEQVLETPTAIGEFVDRWSSGAVEILFRHGGTFDKMVGDCIIGLFGPPFYADTPQERALRAVRAALEMQEFTASFGSDPVLAGLARRPELAKGLGIAVGLNLCTACVGCFGPNQDVTAFSSGMNSTARLQSLAGFREVLAMESLVDALQAAPEAKDLAFGPIVETPVKNVLKPLRHATVRLA